MKWRVLPQTDVAADIVRQLDELMSGGQRVLVLVSGGSAIPYEAEILQQLAKPETLVGIVPVDERYGEMGHADSNIAQLRLSLPLDTTLPLVDVLEGQTEMQQATKHYAEVVSDVASKADSVIAIMGLGQDGHTAGILPHSPAITAEETVIAYDWSDYQRMTLGVPFLRNIDKVFVIAYGEAKQNALQRLHINTEQLEDLPAKLLYDIPDVTIYNDYINEG